MNRFVEGHLLQLANNGYLRKMADCMVRLAQD